MMEIHSVSRPVRAADLPLDKLVSSSSIPQDEKVREVSRQFEALLLKQILSQANKPLFEGGLLSGGGSTNAIYQDVVNQQLADRISQGGTFGFARVLETQLALPGKATDAGSEGVSGEISAPGAPGALNAAQPPRK